MTATIEDLPDELLEHILSIVSPYKELDYCKLVSRKWNHAMKRVVHRKKCNLVNAITSNNLSWEYGSCDGLSMRYTHASCYYDETVFIFGGFSKNHTTAFNDLLAFDLTTRIWRRIQGTGDFPQPKAGASLCAYKDKLILYGGCTRSAIHPLITFKELHTFDLKTNVWRNVITSVFGLPALSCHSATIHGNQMIVNGGMLDLIQINHHTYCFDLDTWSVSKPRSFGHKPSPIYCGSQVYLDEHHLLLTGGWLQVGVTQPNQSSWLLSMVEYPWHWYNVTNENSQWVPLKRLCFTPVISKVGDYLVAFAAAHEDQSSSKNKEQLRALHQDQPEENVNGRRGSLRRKTHSESGNQSPDAPGPYHNLRPSDRRQQRLDILSKYEKKYAIEEVQKPKKNSDMALYVGYIGDLKKTLKIVWREPRCTNGLQSSRALYSQTVGRSEIILFGGLTWNGRERSEELPLVEENALAIIKAPRSFL